MMNMIELQEQLKDFSQQQLVQEMKMPSGNVPQYLVLSEMQRRKRMQAAAAGDQGRPQTTVAEDAVAAAGVPQGGIAQMARTMAPQTDMTQNTGVAAMAGGGAVRRMQEGGLAGISRDVGDYAPTEAEEDWLERWLAGETLTVDNLGPGAYEGAPALDPGDPRNQPPFRQARGDEEPAETGPRPLPLTSLERFLFPNMSEEEIQRRGEERVQAGLPSTRVDQAVDEFSGLEGAPYVPEGSGDLAPVDERQAAAERLYGNLPGMTTGDMLAADQQLLPTQDELAAAGIEPPVPEATQAPEAPESGAGGAGGPSAADRLAQQDRWLTLARFGLGLMSSDQPTFGGAIGEAGMNALDYMQGMEQQRFERDLAERTLAARMAGSGNESSPPPYQMIPAILDQIGVIDGQLYEMDPEENRAQYDELMRARQYLMDQANAIRTANMGPWSALLSEQAGGDGPISVNIGDSAAG